MKERIHSIDIVRGLIMVIMTLDHARDFLHFPGPAPLDIAHTNLILFFTRWITHFCAPTFVFLSGVSAYLAGQRRNKRELSIFLIKRGLWLILSDVLIISLLFSFDISYQMQILEVLWATGFGMIILAVLLHTQMRFIAAVAVIILFGHNLLDYLTLPKSWWSAMFLSARGAFIPLSDTRAIVVLYAVIPWTGALLLGYVFGQVYQKSFEAKKRRLILLCSGLSLITLFIALRFTNHYGDPSHWAVQRNWVYTVLSFLNTTKQTPSLLFICMTLGPVLVLLSQTEKLNNQLTIFCRVFGNVPYFYFILHLAMIRVLNIILILIAGLPFQSDGSPIVWQAAGFGRPLGEVYLFWIGTVCTLYYACSWYGNYKRSHNYWWLAYL